MTKKQTTLMSNTSANACRETNCTCYSFVTTKAPVITHRGFVFIWTSSLRGRTNRGNTRTSSITRWTKRETDI